MTASDPRDLRVGDAERDDATRLLQEHLSAGRLDAEEFDDRVQQALQATHESQLANLFRDLPGRRPGQSLAPAPMQQAPARISPIPPIAWWVGTATLATFTLVSMLASFAHHDGPMMHGPGHGPHVRGGPTPDQVTTQSHQPGFWVVLGALLLVALVVTGVFVVRRVRTRRRRTRRG